jgi:hypothetical protein
MTTIYQSGQPVIVQELSEEELFTMNQYLCKNASRYSTQILNMTRKIRLLYSVVACEAIVILVLLIMFIFAVALSAV